jgi:hypothetical protein
MRFDQLHRREFITLIGGAAVAWRSPRARSSRREISVRFHFQPFAEHPYVTDPGPLRESLVYCLGVAAAPSYGKPWIAFARQKFTPEWIR